MKNKYKQYKVGQYYQRQSETILIERIGMAEGGSPVARVRGTHYFAEKCESRNKRNVCKGCHSHNQYCVYLCDLKDKWIKASLKNILLLGE